MQPCQVLELSELECRVQVMVASSSCDRDSTWTVETVVSVAGIGQGFI